MGMVKHEWYNADVISVSDQNIQLRYSDNSTENIVYNSQCFYFVKDQIKNVHPFLKKLCEHIDKEETIPTMKFNYQTKPKPKNKNNKMGNR
eukprot:UN01378